MKRLIPVLVLLIAAMLTVAVRVTSDATEAMATQTITPTQAKSTVAKNATPRPTPKPTVKLTPKPTAKPASMSDLDLLSRVVMAEAGGEGGENA